MEFHVLEFSLGLGGGLVSGLGLAWLAGRMQAWLGNSETARLARENRELRRRLGEKDRHVTRMLQETERLAEKLAQGKTLETKISEGGG